MFRKAVKPIVPPPPISTPVFPVKVVSPLLITITDKEALRLAKKAAAESLGESYAALSPYIKSHTVVWTGSARQITVRADNVPENLQLPLQRYSLLLNNHYRIDKKQPRNY
ncbi:MAG TPA: hypothetical protein VJJ52_02105 [Candidatus Nanoarchaeia archaeon]|nr:hypothetical protein [Candidatus Nanoarchaeia archaeon]